MTTYTSLARYGALAVIALAILTVRTLLAFQFPVPWPDETGFVAPAFALARHFTMFVWGMNPDRVVMWMPPGYMVVLAGWFKIFGYSFAGVRWLSALCVLGMAALCGGIVARLAAGRLSVALHAAVVVAFVSPYMLLDANIGRMEGLFSLVILSSLVVCLRGFPVLGGAIVAAAAVIHFNAVYFLLPSVALFAWLLVTRRALTVRSVELWGVAVCALVLGGYALFVRAHLGGFIDDMHFQFESKRSYGVNDPDHPLWPALAAAALALAVLVRERGPALGAFAALYGLGFVLMATGGHEIWYDFALPLGFLLLATALGAARTDHGRAIGWGLRGLCVTSLVLMAAFGFRVTPALAPLLPGRAQFTTSLVPAGDIDRIRASLSTLPAGSTIDFGWSGMEPFFLDTLDRSQLRWTILRHAVTDNILSRRADWRVQCDSASIPELLRRFDLDYPRLGRDTGCRMFKTP